MRIDLLRIACNAHPPCTCGYSQYSGAHVRFCMLNVVLSLCCDSSATLATKSLMMRLGSKWQQATRLKTHIPMPQLSPEPRHVTAELRLAGRRLAGRRLAVLMCMLQAVLQSIAQRQGHWRCCYAEGSVSDCMHEHTTRQVLIFPYQATAYNINNNNNNMHACRM